PFVGNAIEPYKNNVPKVPNICIKVPTAGGKTFIACNAIHTILNAFPIDKIKAVVWLVPSITILEQTLKNLKNSHHPYRQKINVYFNNRVAVFDKETLLQGTGFNTTSIQEQLNIFVFSFDSIRTSNKAGRKVFEENGNLQNFEWMVGKDESVTLMKIIHQLNPLLIVDESHNAETELSIEMLKAFNPCFILDLTATPRKNSNIISFIDAIELKKEQMVKLPVIVYNHTDKTAVIISTLQLQKRLETKALEEEKNGGKYIRPIVLFQVQPKNGGKFLHEEEEKSNVQKLKEKLIELKIPAEQIKIKTANINEIKGLDLMSKNCSVRYIITINALKEGWDCPFAYILASMADKNSAVDVEQIVGRILRQPHIKKHTFNLLNMSYVLTASTKFMDTLQNIVQGLNKAGFSEKDYKLSDKQPVEINQAKSPENVSFFADNNTDEIDINRINNWQENESTNTLEEIEQIAQKQDEKLDHMIASQGGDEDINIPDEINKNMKS
ncbi:MAG: DEAD/DEAH box helicase family protein, partial [Sediminibacterium sp.]|nr:DEAD/DEAH box helicase family protein [Sediminibacterium sp.]